MPSRTGLHPLTPCVLKFIFGTSLPLLTLMYYLKVEVFWIPDAMTRLDGKAVADHGHDHVLKAAEAEAFAVLALGRSLISSWP